MYSICISRLFVKYREVEPKSQREFHFIITNMLFTKHAYLDYGDRASRRDSECGGW